MGVMQICLWMGQAKGSPKMSIPKVKIAVLKNLLIFGEKSLPQSVRLLEGGGLNRYLAEFRLNMDFPYVGLP